MARWYWPTDDEVAALIRSVPMHYADISITAGSVVPVTDSENSFEFGTAGATITAGQAVYLESSSGKYKLADNDSGTAAVRDLYGIALNGASDGQPLKIQRTGTINIGATIVAGHIYCLSSTAGGIMPHADLAATDYTVIVGVALTTANIKLKIYNSATVIA